MRATILPGVPISDAEKIARIRRLCDAISSGDLDDAIELGHPDVVLVRPGGQGELRGPDALREWMEPDAFASQVLEPLDFEVRGGRALIHVRSHVRGAGSGIEMAIDAWTVYTFDDDGKITRAEIFLPHEEAEARAALSGE
jgi:ketosteroid isomerase-like protein